MSPQEAELRELRERLALPDDATPAEVLATYRELERFLAADRVPRRLRGWAEGQLDVARQAALARSEKPKVEAAPAVAGELPELFEDDQASIVTPAAPRQRATAGQERARSERAARGHPSRRARSTPWRGVALLLAIGLAIVGLALGNPQLFPGQAQPAGVGGSASSAQQPAAKQVNQARVAELKATLDKDPKNVDALFELGEMSFEADQWQDAIDWFTRLLEVDPGNLHARTDVGTANFNLGHYDLAKQAWEDVAARDPSDPQVHYNLGFLYANSGTPDLDKAFKEWEMVVQLAPGTDLARTAQAHLDALRK